MLADCEEYRELSSEKFGAEINKAFSYLSC